MSRSMMFLFAVVAVLCVVVEAGRQCPKNEVWHDCGTACPATCWNHHPGFCAQKCVSGCQCRQGFLRNRNWQCVRENRC